MGKNASTAGHGKGDDLPMINYNADYKTLVVSLVQESQVKRMAEVGVHRSTLLKSILRSSWAASIEEYAAIDLWIAWGRTKPEQADALFTYADGLKWWFPQLAVYREDSLSAAARWDDGHFDFVFIDADHSYESVKRDITGWYPKVRSGGLLCGHDYGPPPRGKHPGHPGVAVAVKEIFGDKHISTPSTVWILEVP